MPDFQSLNVSYSHTRALIPNGQTKEEMPVWTTTRGNSSLPPSPSGSLWNRREMKTNFAFTWL